VPPRLEVRDLTKDYIGVRALDAVSLTVEPGEIVGLVGHNGAGKSTLSKILAGLERASDGDLAVDGVPVSPRSAGEAVRAGIGLVPQRLAVIGTLTVRQNMLLGLRAHRRAGGGDPAARLEEIAGELGIAGLLSRRADRIGPATQRLLMIARTLLREPKLLILDEPSAAFSAAEVERLFAIVRRLRERGIAVIYVSHRLEEVLALSDRVVAFAQGRVIADRPAATLDKAALADLIAGRHVEHVSTGSAPAAAPARRDGVPALVCRDVTVAPKLRRIDLEVGAGEVVGLTGLVGSGRTTLLNALWGVAAPITDGEVLVAGEPFTPSRPRAAMARRVAYVPENRARNSLVASMSVLQNVTLPTVRRYRSRVRPLLGRRPEREAVAPLLERLRVRPAGALQRPISALSGGNQQKAIIARWLLIDVGLLLFDEPTEGVDVGGREEIYAVVRELAQRGVGVLLSSSDVEEVVEQCDRVLVMREGTIAAELAGAELTVDRVSRACIA